MTRKTAALSVAVAVTALVAGGMTLSSSAAPNVKSHTFHYDAKTTSVVRLDKKDRVASSDLSSRHLSTAGEIRGGALLTCHQRTTHSSSVQCKTAIALKGGILYGNASLSFSSFELRGTITGGSGIFRGAHGTLSSVASSSKRSILSITYKL